jgi:hypothetical protein
MQLGRRHDNFKNPTGARNRPELPVFNIPMAD